jgi:ABC-type nitrate/sulfonate/bicarbonate transport system substrate-binding protein
VKMRGLGTLLVAAVLCGLALRPVSAQVRYRVQMAGVLSYEQNLPVFAALAQGFYDQEGVEVTRLVFGSGAGMRTAVMAKEFDFGYFAFVHVPLARLGGSPWKAVLALHDREIFSLVVRNELKGQVKQVQDLRGRILGSPIPGSGGWMAANLFLRKAGLDPERDVRFLVVGGDPGVIYSAIRTGRVDAYPTWEPHTTRALLEGLGYALVRAWADKDHREWYGSDKMLSLVLVTREDVIQRDPDLVGRIVRATRRGLEYVRVTSPERLATELIDHPRTREYFTGLARPFVVEMFRKIRSGFGTGCLSRRGFEAEMRLAVQYQVVRQPISFEEFADPRWAGVCP